MKKRENKYIRKPVVFNKHSAWHMEVLKRIENESNNFSGYVMSILKGHFDIKPKLDSTKEKLEEIKVDEIKKEQPKLAAQQTNTDQVFTKPKLFKK